jgi:hypothetical protein
MSKCPQRKTLRAFITTSFENDSVYLVLRCAVWRPYRDIAIPVVQFGWVHDVLFFEECMDGTAMTISFGNQITAVSSFY